MHKRIIDPFPSGWARAQSEDSWGGWWELGKPRLDGRIVMLYLGSCWEDSRGEAGLGIYIYILHHPGHKFSLFLSMFFLNNAQPSKILGQKSCCTSWDIHNLKQFAPEKKTDSTCIPAILWPLLRHRSLRRASECPRNRSLGRGIRVGSKLVDVAGLFTGKDGKGEYAWIIIVQCSITYIYIYYPICIHWTLWFTIGHI